MERITTLPATRYSKAGPLLDRPSSFDVVRAFLDAFGKDEHPRILAIDSELLRKKSAFGLPNEKGFTLLPYGSVAEGQILKAAVSHGDHSIFFLPSAGADLKRAFREHGYYSNGEATDMLLGGELPIEAVPGLINFLAGGGAAAAGEMFTFSHDAEFYYEIPARTARGGD